MVELAQRRMTGQRPMTRDEAIAVLRAGLSNLPRGDMRMAAFAAFDRLVHDVDAGEQLLEQAYNDLLAAVPELKPTVDRIWRTGP